MVNQLLAQKEQRSKGPVLTLEEAARFADRPLAPVQFEPLVQEQIPELKKQFEQSPAEVARRQREEQDIEDEEERARREREQKQQRALTRRGRTVFTGLNL
jgi:molecular chaperone GrpE (heat shock protein)